MAFLDKFPKSPTIEELKVEFQKFTNSHAHATGIKFSAKQMKETVYYGMYLVRHLPSGRDSVFEYISTVYEDFVKEYISQAVDLTVSCSKTR